MKKLSREIWIVAAKRTPFGALSGGLKDVSAIDLAVHAGKAAIAQSGAVIVRLHDNAVDVIDSGPGLSAEDAARLFERGYRGTHAGHSQGGGIGLSIVRRLCALYGWDVHVRPGEQRGVVATLRFAQPPA